MAIARSVAEVLEEHVYLELECIDRMYLNLYVPILRFCLAIARPTSVTTSPFCRPNSR